MRTRTFLISVSLCLCGLYAIAGAQSKANDSEVQKRFVGHWRLVKFENFDEKGGARRRGIRRRTNHV